MHEQKQKSKSWDKVDKESKVILGQGMISGFPFDEGWPKDSRGKTYEIIVRNGERLDATVDDSESHRADGILWRYGGNRSLSKYVVAAWREK